MIKLHTQDWRAASRYCQRVIIICCLCFCVSGIFGQNDILDHTIQLSSESVSAIECISAIREQHEIIISYSSQYFDKNASVTFANSNPTIHKILKVISEDQSLDYRVKNKYKIVLINDPDRQEALSEASQPSKIFINGIVKDLDSGEPLIGSYVYNKSLTTSTTTDVNGYFQLEVVPNEDSLRVSYVGYGENMVDVNDLYTKRIKYVFLKPSLQIEEVVIESSVTRKLESIKSHNYYINFKDLNEGVSSFGEHDPYRSLKLLPSVQSGREAENNIYVRGGGPDQNLILMDGVPLYETSHILGLSSIFNIDAIKNIQVYKDAFPAKFGGRLSSVIDFQMKEGNVYEHKRSFNFSPSSIRGHVEGPLKKGVSGYNVSIRSSFLDLFYSDRLKDVLGYTDTEISFLDFNAKVSHQFEDGSVLKVNSYYGKDIVLLAKEESLGDVTTQFDITNSDRITWGNAILGVHYSRAFSDKLNSKFSLNGSSYTADTRSSFTFDSFEGIDSTEGALDIITQSKINEIAFTSEFDYFVNNDLKINFGAGYSFHSMTPTIRRSKLIEPGSITEVLGDEFEHINANEYFAYAEGNYDLPYGLTFNLGARFNIYEVRKTLYPSLQPRLSIAKQFGDDHHVVVSANRMTQFVHLLVNNGIGLPSRLWLPSTDILPPEFTNQFSISYQYNLSPDITIELGGYYKQLFNVVEYSSNTDLFSSFVNNDDFDIKFESDNDWENFVDNGESESRGLEFSMRDQKGRLKWNVSYSLSKTDRTFETINNGKPFPYRYDRRHDLSLYLKYSINPNFHLFGTWVFGSGDAFSLATEEFQAPDGNFYLIPPDRNNFRFAYYKKFDVGLQYERDLPGEGQKMRMDFGIQNVFNRENAYYYYVLKNPVSNEFEVEQVSVFPLLPQFNIYLTL